MTSDEAWEEAYEDLERERDALRNALAEATVEIGRLRLSNEEFAIEVGELKAKLASYDNCITWDTTCLGCARLLDASIRDYERILRLREKLEAIVAAGPSFPHRDLAARALAGLLLEGTGTEVDESRSER